MVAMNPNICETKDSDKDQRGIRTEVTGQP